MGLTLHYSGNIRNLDDIPILIAEVEDICRSKQWEWERVDEIVEVPAEAVPIEPVAGDPKKLPLSGIYLTPPDCETVIIVFAPSGRLTSGFQLTHALRFPFPSMLYDIHVKTQFAGPDIHIELVALLKYLEKKYFENMRVYDEGGYWDTLDEKILLQSFDHYRMLINSVKSALQNEDQSE